MNSHDVLIESQPSLRMRLRRRLGPKLQQLAFASGLMKVMRGRSGSGAIVLMYHSVADVEHEPWIDPQNHVPARIFAEQMTFLAKHRQVMPLDELVRRLHGGQPLEKEAVVITFDDGYLDNLTVAAPILDSLNLPATIFVPTGYIDRGETQWIDQAFTAFRQRTRSVLRWGGDTEQLFRLDDEREQRVAYRVVCRDLLQATASRRRLLLNRLLDELAPALAPPRLTMNWTDVHELVATYPRIGIGSHTVEHLDLTNVPLAEARRELLESVESIERELDFRPRHFSFCYGRSSDDLRNLVQGLDFDVAFGGCRYGPIIRHGADRLRLPRVAGPPRITGFEMLTSTINTRFWRWLAK